VNEVLLRTKGNTNIRVDAAKLNGRPDDVQSIALRDETRLACRVDPVT
jgi:hypothetical protein